MTQRLKDKTALITAAGQGIGLASVKAFLEQGAKVVAVDINETSLATLRELDGVQVVQADLTSADDLARVVAELPDIDVLFNCAGFVADGSILDCEEKDWTFSFDLNVNAMYRMMRALLPGMLERGGASIINMSSVASSMKGVPNRFAYCASKAAVIGMTKSVAVDYITQGIRCNAICPGTVDSPSMHERLRATGDYDTALVNFIARQPMGRIGTAEEIASLAVYLASDESAFTTGQTFAIDGGWAI
ncbi:SDR family oxidoreductase [Planktotalea sp.]|uniref:SDR family oxidoreductase n=1 Tax=Planktotalea sp. TaxID=2029877 RepID=UPI003297DE1F